MILNFLESIYKQLHHIEFQVTNLLIDVMWVFYFYGAKKTCRLSIYLGITLPVVKCTQLPCSILLLAPSDHSIPQRGEGEMKTSSSEGNYRGILDQQNAIIHIGTVPGLQKRILKVGKLDSISTQLQDKQRISWQKWFSLCLFVFTL